MILTHGIYGAGGNWRAIARKVTDRRPDWGIVLVDLRLHGRSEAGDPPHTVAACAGDLAALVRELGDVRAIAGHSFGGKTALATRSLVDLDQTWVLDASPSTRPGALADLERGASGDGISSSLPDFASAAPPRSGGGANAKPGREYSAGPLAESYSVNRVLALMEQLPPTWSRREDFIAAVVAKGHDTGFAHWLAMNLIPRGDVLVNRLDLAAVRSLLADYYALDLWADVLAPRGALEFVVAERSVALTAEDRERLAHAPGHVRVHSLPVGHWLHVEAPAQVIELFATFLPDV